MFSSAAVVSLARQTLRRGSTAVLRRTARPLAAATAIRFSEMTGTTTPRSFSGVPTTMFCRQCEQTENHEACTTSQGICGKKASTSACQDALLESVKSLSTWCQAARQQGIDEAELKEANVLTLQAMFSTLTNVNFDDARITEYVQELEACKQQLKTLVATPPTEAVAALDWRTVNTPEALAEAGVAVSVPARQAQASDADAFSLNEICTYGLKGVCAYATHCYQLGKMDANVMAEIHRLFSSFLILARPSVTCCRPSCASAKSMPKFWLCSIKHTPRTLAIPSPRNTVLQPLRVRRFLSRDTT